MRSNAPENRKDDPMLKNDLLDRWDRNYFLHPDQRVKDARTKFQMGNFHAVLDGDIQGFLDSVLRWRAGQPVEDGDDE